MPGMVKRYILVAKPGIVLGNLISAAGGFFLASKGSLDAGLLVPVVIGISLIVASGCVFNNHIDRHIDRKMARTRHRVLAQGLMSPSAALVYALVLGTAGAALLWATTNMLCAAVVLAGFTIYVGVYSMYLKRRCEYATLIGSLAGAAPPLAGYCAAAGRFDAGAAILLLIFSVWQIPHSYAIAVWRLKDYAAAALPVLPARQGPASIRMHLVGSILVFAAASPLLTLGGYTGDAYLAAAVAMGLIWLVAACTGSQPADAPIWAKRLFVFSILNILVLSVMMSIDSAAPGATHMLLSLSFAP